MKRRVRNSDYRSIPRRLPHKQNDRACAQNVRGRSQPPKKLQLPYVLLLGALLLLSFLLSLWTSDRLHSELFPQEKVGDEFSLLSESVSRPLDQSDAIQSVFSLEPGEASQATHTKDQNNAIQETSPKAQNDNIQMLRTKVQPSEPRGKAYTSTSPDAQSSGKVQEELSSDPATTQISLSSADEQLLCTVPGIGPVTARAILRRREELGGKMCVEDLLSVPGIKEKKFARFKAYFRP